MKCFCLVQSLYSIVVSLEDSVWAQTISIMQKNESSFSSGVGSGNLLCFARLNAPIRFQPNDPFVFCSFCIANLAIVSPNRWEQLPQFREHERSAYLWFLVKTLGWKTELSIRTLSSCLVTFITPQQGEHEFFLVSKGELVDVNMKCIHESMTTKREEEVWQPNPI